jgi:DNA-binding transcriptional LysR family regulator
MDMLQAMRVYTRVVDIVAGNVDCVVRVGELNDSGLIARQIRADAELHLCVAGLPRALWPP